MIRIKPFFILSLVFFSFIGCKKDVPNSGCLELKNTLISTNIDNVRSIISDLIYKLPSQEYTEENIILLAASFTNECAISSKVLCFDCIKTLPSITEIELKFTIDQTTVRKIIDISYTPANKIRFSWIHE